MTWFSFGPNDGFVTHETRQEAVDAAESELRWFRNEASSSGEWHEEVLMICWGKVQSETVDVTPELEAHDFRLQER